MSTGRCKVLGLRDMPGYEVRCENCVGIESGEFWWVKQDALRVELRVDCGVMSGNNGARGVFVEIGAKDDFVAGKLQVSGWGARLIRWVVGRAPVDKSSVFAFIGGQGWWRWS